MGTHRTGVNANKGQFIIDDLFSFPSQKQKQKRVIFFFYRPLDSNGPRLRTQKDELCDELHVNEELEKVSRKHDTDIVNYHAVR